MSKFISPGCWVTVAETEVTCPICEYTFDSAEKFDKSPYPLFNMKCPRCKGKITIHIAIMGGNTTCWETNCPPNVERLKTETPYKANGIPVPDKPLFECDNDDTEEVEID